MPEKEDIAAFPRGGKEALPALERKRLREEGKAQAQKDFLSDRPGSKKQKTTNQEEDDELLAFTREASQGRLPKFVELLKFKSLNVDAKIWGCILAVTSKGLNVSLPDGLKGFVPLEETSDVIYKIIKKQPDQQQKPGRASSRQPSLQALFHVGQLVRASVISLDEVASGSKGHIRKKVVLSLRVARVNTGLSAGGLTEGLAIPACVQSIEDHGYTLDLGVKGVKAFLDNAKLQGGEGSASLIPGMMVEAVISQADDKRLVRVTLERETVSTTLTKEWNGLTLGSLLPGALINVKVRKILADGLLVSFLTYFNGTIDPFHISLEGCVGELGESFSEGQKLRARVLYVDLVTKTIALSLLPHLLDLHPIKLPAVGSLVKKAAVRRVDGQLGVLLSLPKWGQGYAHISDVADEKVNNLEKVLQVGQTEDARVIGSRLMDGLAVVSLKPSAVEQFLTDGIKPGQLVKGKIVLVEEKGMLVNIAKDLNAFVPNEHISDLGERQGKAKYKVGSSVSGRILAVNAARKRASMTLKKALVNSKVKPLAAWEDVTVGGKAQGTVHGFADYGCFVKFYGDISGMIHVSELGLLPGKKASDAYAIGQVLKVTVLAFNPETKRLQLTLANKKDKGQLEAGMAVPEQPGILPGDLLDAEVVGIDRGDEDAITGYTVSLHRQDKVAGSGYLTAAHLCDHPGAEEVLQEGIQVGSKLGQVLVLEKMRASSLVAVTCKPSLLKAAEKLPKEMEDLTEASIIPGYIANVVSEGVFVRFLNGLTGRAGLAQLSDTFVSDPLSVFAVGQTVNARIVQVNLEKKQFAISLKQSVTGNTTAAYAASLFQSIELAAKIKADVEVKAGEASVDWSKFGIGSFVTVVVHERKDYGTIVDLVDDPDVVGLIPHHQGGESLEVEDEVSVRVMDVNKANGIVELTAKEDLCGKSMQKLKAGKKKSSKTASVPAVGASVDCTVQIAREDYAVVTYGTSAKDFAFLSVNDFNARDNLTAQLLPISSIHKLTMSMHPSMDTGDRAILEFVAPKPAKESRRDKREKLRAASKIKAGTILKGSIVEVNELFVVVELPEGMVGRIHITEVSDDLKASKSLLSEWEVGNEVTSIVLGTWHDSRRSAHNSIPCFELATRASLLQASAKEAHALIQKRVNASSLSHKTTYTGFVSQIAADYLLVSITPSIAGRVYVLDISSDPETLNHFQDTFEVGQPVQCQVLKADKRSLQFDLTLIHDGNQTVKPSIAIETAKPGDYLMGKVVKGAGSGLRIQVGPHTFGTASLFELHDSWVANALAAFPEGSYVKCCVLKEQASVKKEAVKKRKRDTESAEEAPQSDGLLLSLRPSSLSKSAAEAAKDVPGTLKRKSAKIGAEVMGYVKAASKYGVFVSLAKDLDARIKMSNLADSFVEDVNLAFPVGKRVKGHIVSVCKDKIEMSLKAKASKKDLLKKLKEGQVVKGVIQRIKEFGLFVQLQHSSLVGFAHKSDLSDKFVKNVSELYKEGQGVRARVLEVKPDEEKLKLGLKQSFFVDIEEFEDVNEEAGEAPDLDAEMLDVVDADSDDGDWRNALNDSAASEDEDDAKDDVVLANNYAGAEASPSEGDLVLKKQKLSLGNGKAAKERQEDSVSTVDEEGAEDSDGNNGDEEGLEDPAAMVSTAALPAAGGVGWGDDSSDAEPDNDSPQEPEEEDERPSKREMKRRKKAQDDAVRRTELARSEGKAPTSAVEFERDLMGSPNSSYLWIKYMAFQISLGEVDKARAVAEQALQKINYREEGEKFNVWQARLNLEMQYGSPPDEAVMKIFQRALSFTDQKKLYLSLITILERASKEDLLEQTFKAMTRKFSQSAKVWLRQLAHYQQKGDAEGSRKVLERATSSAPSRKHVKDKQIPGCPQDFVMQILRQAALQEFSFGFSERGRSIFETLLRNYPKRLDLWSIYLDQEIKQGDSDRIRRLFERATSLQIPPKKIKFLFKRYLEYENKHGTPATVSGVKQAAKSYVEQHLAAA